MYIWEGVKKNKERGKQIKERGWARWVMGTMEGTCCDEYQVLYVRDESLDSNPESNIALYVI